MRWEQRKSVAGLGAGGMGLGAGGMGLGVDVAGVRGGCGCDDDRRA